MTDIAPDVMCPHCGPVIVCPHTPCVSYPPHCIKTPPSPRDIEWTDNFVENVALLALHDPDCYAKCNSTIQRRADRMRAERDGTTVATPTGAIAQPGKNPAWVAAAIRGELGKLASATEGVRNHTLFHVACRVFEFVKGGHANEGAARAELERIASEIGLRDQEIRATVESAWQHVEPCDVPPPRGAA